MILPLEQQVAPLALCHRLKELGAPQDSAFYWQSNVGTMTGPGGSIRIDHVAVVLVLASTLDVRFICAAYTVAELGAMLPEGVSADRDPYTEARFGRVMWQVQFERGREVLIQRGHSEAEARAGLLVTLAESGVVKWDRTTTAT